MACNCPDCRPVCKCHTPKCDGTPEPGERGYCRECADARADAAHEARKDDLITDNSERW